MSRHPLLRRAALLAPLSFTAAREALSRGLFAKALDANEAFAKANGFAGTPVIVRASDGAVLHGYRDAATLRRFAAGEAGGKQ